MTLLNRYFSQLVTLINQPKGLQFRSTSSYPANYNRTCTLILGQEFAHSLEEIFLEANIPLDFEPIYFSKPEPPVELITESILRNRLCLLGSCGTTSTGTGEDNLNTKLRKLLGLNASVIHVKSLSGVKTRHKYIDCFIISEQVEGEFSINEYEKVRGVVECSKIVTADTSRKIAHLAFDYATRYHRKKVISIHKANILKLRDGMFLNCCEEVSKLYPTIKFESMIVDNCAMQMVRKPTWFEVIVMPNLYGSLIANVAAGLVGGPELLASSFIADNCVVFGPALTYIFPGHDSLSCNPISMLLSSINLLNHVNLSKYGATIRNALEKSLTNDELRIHELEGQAAIQKFTQIIIRNLDYSLLENPK